MYNASQLCRDRALHSSSHVCFSFTACSSCVTPAHHAVMCHLLEIKSHPVRLFEVCNGSTLSKELRVAQNLKVHLRVCAIPPQHLRCSFVSCQNSIDVSCMLQGSSRQWLVAHFLNGFGRFDWHRGLLNYDFGGLRYTGNHAGCLLPIGQISCLASSHARGLGGSVDAAYTSAQHSTTNSSLVCKSRLVQG